MFSFVSLFSPFSFLFLNLLPVFLCFCFSYFFVFLCFFVFFFFLKKKSFFLLSRAFRRGGWPFFLWVRVGPSFSLIGLGLVLPSLGQVLALFFLGVGVGPSGWGRPFRVGSGWPFLLLAAFISRSEGWPFFLGVEVGPSGWDWPLGSGLALPSWAWGWPALCGYNYKL